MRIILSLMRKKNLLFKKRTYIRETLMVTPVFSSFWLTKFFFAKEQKGSSYQLYMRKFSYYRSWRTFRGCRVAPFTNSTNWSLSQKGLDLNGNEWLCVIHMMCMDTGKVKLAMATCHALTYFILCVYLLLFSLSILLNICFCLRLGDKQAEKRIFLLMLVRWQWYIRRSLGDVR